MNSTSQSSPSKTAQAKIRDKNKKPALWQFSNNQAISDYLNFAILRACEALEKYANAAKMVSTPKERNLLKYMARRKRYQAMKLQSEFPEACYFMQQNAETDSGTSIANYLLDVNLKPLDNLEDTFFYILRNERKILNMYKKLIQLEKDFEVKVLFKYLTKLQSQDIQCLEWEFARLKKNEKTMQDVICNGSLKTLCTGNINKIHQISGS
ncbi:MAG: hypothetical protein GF401_06010 [Chitinivibrionales bacterium]|nr:hypothetical protein [Chitinivibrionales bacterium]